LAVIVLLELAFKRTKRSNKFAVTGSVALITGGSSGLGLAIAEQLLQRGCRLVILIARNNDKLEKSKKYLSEIYQEDRVIIRSADVKNYDQIEGLCAALEREGIIPDMVFCCAGASDPGFFLEQDHSAFEEGIKLNYLGSVNVAHAIGKKWIMKEKKDRKIVFISSTVGLMGMIGYAQYAPTKFAIRGLAECLRQEFKPLGIDVHVYYVSTINTPGFEQENVKKPQVTKILEGVEMSDASAESRASVLIKGIERGDFAITSDFMTNIIYSMGKGMSLPNSPLILNSLIGLISPFIPWIWNLHADSVVASNVKTKSQ
jgi:3-dehydrosphinganine reductase